MGRNKCLTHLFAGACAFVAIGLNARMVLGDVSSLPHWKTSYSVATDVLSQWTPRQYDHSLELAASYVLKNWVELSAGIHVNYFSLGTEIPDNGDNPVLGSGFTVGASRKDKLSGRLTLEYGLDTELPMSGQAQIEGLRAITEASSALNIKVYKDIYSITPELEGDYIFNTYDKSPTTLEPLPWMTGTARLKNSVKIISQLRTFFTLGIKATRTTDGTETLYNTAGSLGLGYELKKWNFKVSYSSGGYTDDRALDMWFMDRYRQVVSVGVAYGI